MSWEFWIWNGMHIVSNLHSPSYVCKPHIGWISTEHSVLFCKRLLEAYFNSMQINLIFFWDNSVKSFHFNMFSLYESVYKGGSLHILKALIHCICEDDVSKNQGWFLFWLFLWKLQGKTHVRTEIDIFQKSQHFLRYSC